MADEIINRFKKAMSKDTSTYVEGKGTYNIKLVKLCAGILILSLTLIILAAGCSNGAATAAPIISNVAASRITQSSAIITWTTDVPADSLVEYGLDNTYGSIVPSDNLLKTDHSVPLSGLNLNTTYYFKVTSSDAANNEATSTDHTFTTPLVAVPAREGDTVRVNYTLTLDDGTVADSSANKGPLEFTIGSGQLIPEFEQAVIGMVLGESKSITIPAADAYGPYLPERITEVDRSELPATILPEVGMVLQAIRNGITVDVKIVAVSDLTVTIDFNHPLAGKNLTFYIELVEIL